MAGPLGRYLLVRRIGAGGMAEIWKAKATGPAGFEKVLAIKRILPQHVQNEDFVDMFIEEAKLAAMLVHPNIVQVFDFGLSDKQDYFIAMEYVPGPNLSALQKRLRKKNTLMPHEVAVYIVAEASRGLAYAHRAQDSTGSPLHIIHRDVSPQNLLVSFGGEVKITDFGIAKVADAMSRTTEGMIRGKLSYMSPEQARLRSLDHRSDLFSLGVVLHDLLTGEHLFAGRSSQEIFAAVMNHVAAPRDVLEKLPPNIAEVLDTALQLRPDDRYQTATQLEVALTQLLGPDGIVQARDTLSALVRKHFDREFRDESTTDERGETELGVVTKLSDTKSLAKSTTQSSGELLVPESELKPTKVVTPAEHPDLAGAKKPPRRRPLAGITIGFLVIAVLALGGILTKVVLDQRVAVRATPTPTATPGENPTQYAVVTVTVTPPPTKRPARTRRPRATARKTAAPTPRATAKAVATGTVRLKVRPWGKVWIDGKKKSDSVTTQRYTLNAGRHRIRVANPATGKTVEEVITVPANRELTVSVNMATGTVSVK